jgi:hypothetical protein
MERKFRPIVNIEARPVNVSVNRKSWKKIGGGSFMLGGRVIKPKEVFTASESEIPKAFRDVIIQVGGGEYDGVPVTPRKIKFVLQASEEAGLYDIVDLKGKKVNEISLPIDKASTFIQELES